MKLFICSGIIFWVVIGFIGYNWHTRVQREKWEKQLQEEYERDKVAATHMMNDVKEMYHYVESEEVQKFFPSWAHDYERQRTKDFTDLEWCQYWLCRSYNDFIEEYKNCRRCFYRSNPRTSWKEAFGVYCSKAHEYYLEIKKYVVKIKALRRRAN